MKYRRCDRPTRRDRRDSRSTLRRARGMTLVELVIATGVAIAILGILATIVTRVMAVNAAAADHLSSLVAVGRLGEQFRQDAHAAASAERDATGGVERLRFALADRTIEYTLAAAGVERVVLKNNQPVARETFVMPHMRATGFDDRAPPDEVTLLVARVARPAGGVDTLHKAFPITARLGRDARPRGGP